MNPLHIFPSAKTRNWVRAGLVLLFVLALAAGCRSVRRGEPFTGPMPLDDPQVARGQMVFMRHCHSCHPGGEGGLGPGLNYPLPTLAMRTQVRLGLGSMPSFHRDQITPEELSDMMAYLVALRRQPPLPEYAR